MSSVKLVSITPEPEKTVVFIARVSNPDNQNNPEIYKLVKYLIKNKHWSPFEHSFATFEIITSRAIAQQIIRHRSFSYQEFSQRYSEVTELEPIELRRQAIKNRQSSEEIFNPGIDTIPANLTIDHHLQETMLLYKKLIAAGVAKEVARFILPLTTQTTLYMSGSIRSFIHYLQLRNDQHAQKEHQIIAQQIELILRQQLPTIFQALDEINEVQKRYDGIIQLVKQRDSLDSEVLLKQLLQIPI